MILGAAIGGGGVGVIMVKGGELDDKVDGEGDGVLYWEVSGVRSEMVGN